MDCEGLKTNFELVKKRKEMMDDSQIMMASFSSTHYCTTTEHMVDPASANLTPRTADHEIIISVMKNPDMGKHLYISIHSDGRLDYPNDENNNVDSISLRWFNHRKVSPSLEEDVKKIWKLQNIKELRLCGYPHSKLPEGIGNLTSLTRLEIQSDKLKSISGSILRKLSNLQELDISNCYRLRTLPTEIGRLGDSFEQLTVYGCPRLKEIPDELCEVRSLKRLALGFLDGLEYIPKDIGSLCNLEFLNIQDCPLLHELPTSIGNLQQLQTFVLAATGILSPLNMQVPMEIKNCSNLRLIEFSGLAPETILSIFSEPWTAVGVGDECRHRRCPLHTLEVIRLSRCDLTEDHCRTILPNLPLELKELVLMKNHISSLDGILSAGLPQRLRKLRLDHNPVMESTDPQERMNLMKLLNTYHELSSLDWTFSMGRIFTPEILHLMFLNKCGRKLLAQRGICSSRSVPDSLWPNVLEQVWEEIPIDIQIGRINQHGHSGKNYTVINSHAMRMSVVYSLLQGPALLEGNP